MKHQQSFMGSKAEFGEFIKKMVPELFSGKLQVEGAKVALPSDRDLDYKVKFDDDEASGSFTVKVSWDNIVETEEDDEMELEV